MKGAIDTLGRRPAQRGLFEADHLYLDWVGENTFYGVLAGLRGELFRHDDFAFLYCPDNGRRSVPPSLLATALLLQAHDHISDAEAAFRARYNIRWKVALGVEIDEAPFAKSTLPLFRAHLILHDEARSVFIRTLDYARKMGYLKGRRTAVTLDTTGVLGQGAVKDTYIEYAGMVDEHKCAPKMKGKQELADGPGLDLIVLESQELLTLDRKLGPFMEA